MNPPDELKTLTAPNSGKKSFSPHIIPKTEGLEESLYFMYLLLELQSFNVSVHVDLVIMAKYIFPSRMKCYFIMDNF